MKQNTYFKTFLNGLLYENPSFVLFLGMCPTLAVTTGVVNAIGMGLSTTAVLICSNIVISLLRKFIPDKIRIAAYIVIIAGFVTVVQMLMNAYVPALSSSLGIYIPLIVVNCIILGRAEAFANKNSVGKSMFDGSWFYSRSYFNLSSKRNSRSRNICRYFIVWQRISAGFHYDTSSGSILDARLSACGN